MFVLAHGKPCLQHFTSIPHSQPPLRSSLVPLPDPVVVAVNFPVTKPVFGTSDLFSRVARSILFGVFYCPFGLVRSRTVSVPGLLDQVYPGAVPAVTRVLQEVSGGRLVFWPGGLEVLTRGCPGDAHP